MHPLGRTNAENVICVKLLPLFTLDLRPRPLQGKSTLLNALLGEERALTGPEPGLTRDAVRAAWAWGEQAVELVDTAGWIGAGRTEG